MLLWHPKWQSPSTWSVVDVFTQYPIQFMQAHHFNHQVRSSITHKSQSTACKPRQNAAPECHKLPFDAWPEGML